MCGWNSISEAIFVSYHTKRKFMFCPTNTTLIVRIETFNVANWMLNSNRIAKFASDHKICWNGKHKIIVQNSSMSCLSMIYMNLFTFVRDASFALYRILLRKFTLLHPKNGHSNGPDQFSKIMSKKSPWNQMSIFAIGWLKKVTNTAPHSIERLMWSYLFFLSRCKLLLIAYFAKLFMSSQ